MIFFKQMKFIIFKKNTEGGKFLELRGLFVLLPVYPSDGVIIVSITESHSTSLHLTKTFRFGGGFSRETADFFAHT